MQRRSWTADMLIFLQQLTWLIWLKCIILTCQSVQRVVMCLYKPTVIYTFDNLMDAMLVKLTTVSNFDGTNMRFH